MWNTMVSLSAKYVELFKTISEGGKKKRCMDWLAVSAWHLALSCLGQPQPVCFGLPVHTFSCVFRYEPRTCWCLSLIHNFLQVVLD